MKDYTYSPKARLRLTSMNSKACSMCIFDGIRKHLEAIKFCAACGKALHPSLQLSNNFSGYCQPCWIRKEKAE